VGLAAVVSIQDTRGRQTKIGDPVVRGGWVGRGGQKRTGDRGRVYSPDIRYVGPPVFSVLRDVACCVKNQILGLLTFELLSLAGGFAPVFFMEDGGPRISLLPTGYWVSESSGSFLKK
jgi:hypothetical protein